MLRLDHFERAIFSNTRTAIPLIYFKSFGYEDVQLEKVDSALFTVVRQRFKKDLQTNDVSKRLMRQKFIRKVKTILNKF